MTDKRGKIVFIHTYKSIVVITGALANVQTAALVR